MPKPIYIGIQCVVIFTLVFLNFQMVASAVTLFTKYGGACYSYMCTPTFATNLYLILVTMAVLSISTAMVWLSVNNIRKELRK